MQGEGFPSCLCLLPRSGPMGRRVTSPELGCVNAEDGPRASGTRPTALGLGSGSRSPGQRRVPQLGGSSILTGMPPKELHQVPPPQAATHPPRASLP